MAIASIVSVGAIATRGKPRSTEKYTTEELELMRKTRIHSYAQPVIIEWVDRYKISRGRPRSHLGSQSLFFYFISYNWSELWCSAEEILNSPDYTKGAAYRSQFKIDAYVPRSYCLWLDSMNTKADGTQKAAIDFLDDHSPDRIAELKAKFGNRMYMVRGYSFHLNRAVIILYKLSLENPDILEIDADLIRPEGWRDRQHNFQSVEYTLAYSNKLAKLIGVDFSKPPSISLTEY